VSVSQHHSAPVGRTFSEGVLRVLFGVFLATVAVAVTLYTAEWFAALTVVMILLGAWEWHRMVRSPAEAAAGDQQPVYIQAAITGIAIACAVAAVFWRLLPLAFVFLAVGTVLSFEWARRRGDNPATGKMAAGYQEDGAGYGWRAAQREPLHKRRPLRWR